MLNGHMLVTAVPGGCSRPKRFSACPISLRAEVLAHGRSGMLGLRSEIQHGLLHLDSIPQKCWAVPWTATESRSCVADRTP
jgi:hypothetical protein